MEGTEFQVAKRTIGATKLQEEDAVVSVQVVTENQHAVLQTKGGYFLRFPASEIPEKKKGAVGVRGMKVDPKDSLQAAYALGQEERFVAIKEKEVALHRLRIAGRDGRGVKRP